MAYLLFLCGNKIIKSYAFFVNSFKTRNLAYYINNAGGNEFTITGISTDNYTLSLTSISIEGVDSEGTKKSISQASVAGASWSFSGIGFSEFAARSGVDAVVTVTATDTAENEADYTLNIEFDTTAPSWNNTNFTVNDGAYDSENANWYNSASMPFTGSYTEDGSGIETVYYWVVNPSTSADAAAPDMTYTASTESFATDPTGQFSTADAGSTETFKATLGTFVASSYANKVYFKAVDKVGNITSDAQEISVYIDSAAPSIATSSSSTILTNGTADKSLTGTVTDDASGVDGITVTLGTPTPVIISTSDTTFTNGKLDYTPSNSSWTLTLYSAFLSSISSEDSISITAVVTDVAGNASSASTVGTLMVDSTEPTIANIAVSDSVSGSMTVDGSSKDVY